MFHLQEIRWDLPQFLSKSSLGTTLTKIETDPNGSLAGGTPLPKTDDQGGTCKWKFSNFLKKRINLFNQFPFAGASLIVCFWAEVFHLQEIRWDRPRFLSKSFLGFVAFNIISYSLLIAELVLIWFGQEHLHFYKHIFNGSYAVLMFIGKY